MPYIDPTGLVTGLYENPQTWAPQLVWVDTPPEMPTPVPYSVSRFQARAALLSAGLLDDVNQYFAGLPVDDLGRLAWEQAPTVVRDCEATNIAAQALGLSAETIDQLFIQAATY